MKYKFWLILILVFLFPQISVGEIDNPAPVEKTTAELPVDEPELEGKEIGNERETEEIEGLEAIFSQDKGKSPQDKATSSPKFAGSRGCEVGAGGFALNPLFPEDKLEIVSSHPQFLLQVEQPPASPLRVSIVDPDSTSGKPIIQREFTVSSPGWELLELEELNLEPNKEYIYTVALYCGIFPQWYARGILVKEPLNFSNLANQEKILFLEQKGYWYDALLLAYRQNREQFSQMLQRFQ